MLTPENWKIAQAKDDELRLMVLIDTEEEFDWSQPHSRVSTGVTAMSAQEKAHRIFEKYNIVPIYVCDYPIISQEDGVRPLQEFYADDLCDVGAHLHPWVNPPFDEDVNNFNSYPGNLPASLEREKLRILTEAIEDRFDMRPKVYKAGRYGAGTNTTTTLEALGYEIDTSVLPWTDLSSQAGPDFSLCGSQPYWFGPSQNLCEIPMSIDFAGLLGSSRRALYDRLNSNAGRALHLPGLFARLRLMDRITLTPEGISWQEHRRLVRTMITRNCRTYSFTYHSPSLMPGNTPYVRTQRELGAFLDKFERFFDFFFGELGGIPATPLEIRDSLIPV
ncbi:MAG: WalW protein [Alphaproteobacteria bacterium]|nr:WalW protein [Alphaproteobacteria bacterium]